MPSPPPPTPPPPSQSPMVSGTRLIITPPHTQLHLNPRKSPHPYLEGNLCVDKSATKLLELPPSDITDNSPPITTLQPPTWDQHESSLAQTRVTPSDTPHLAAVNTEK